MGGGVKNTIISTHMVKVEGKRKGHDDGFSNKCASLAKEQRSRLYILCRCDTMLLEIL